MTIHSVVIQKLLSTNAHLSRRVAAHHFKIYTYGTRNAMTIIDSDKTLICLRSACNFIGNLARLQGRFLFVNTNPLVDEIVDQMIKRTGVHNDSSWKRSGFMTNSLSPKKFRSRNKKLNLTSVYPPDCVVILDTEMKSSVILEADRLRVPIVGLVDSSMPWETYKKITYPIPANDSVQFVYLFCNLITKTIQYEQKKLAAARGDMGKDEKLQIGEAAQKLKIDGTNDELSILPYDSLLPASADPLQIKELLDKVVVFKINGNSETRMGCDTPKCAMEISNGLTWLDLLANYMESLNSKYACNIPLLLMNAGDTHDEILKILEKQSNKSIDCHTQDHIHKDKVEDALPFGGTITEDKPHYASDQIEALFSLKKSGKLDDLLSQGKEYILLLNSDNLAEVVDTNILNHLIENDIEYCVEVTVPSELKGSDYQHDESGIELEEQDKLICTTNLWASIKAINSLQESDVHKGNFSISKLFRHPIGINVPEFRTRALETTSDLLLFQSDLYTYDQGILMRNETRTNPANPTIELGPEFEKINDFQSRFKSIPSIIDLDHLKVYGDVWFGTGVILKGTVSINAEHGEKILIPDGVVLENKAIRNQQDVPEEGES